jgi:NAD(P)-dependent dehydrogenase (short-subunit alcohol dehydrogenase family)
MTRSSASLSASSYAKSYPRLRINAVDPGYTATDLNGHRGTQSVEEGAQIIVRMATIEPDGPTGTFADVNGPVPW